ncbi:MAG: methylated-DNA--[protein]-cysteine S-methyltransferase [Anaerolineales bacterium]|nr:methylated-DNA--[protein]-cysteine S-methyltransferase [Anaerolineales bacterium]
MTPTLPHDPWLETQAPAPDAVTKALDALYAAGPAPAATARATARARATLRAAADPLWYAGLERSALGPLYVALSARGLVSVRFGLTEAAFLALVRQQTGQTPVRNPARAGAAARQVAEYAAGRRTTFELPVDLSHVTAFQRQVLLAASRIPRGQVRTYAELARQIGRPRAARAVGQALSHNPLPIVVPCHRVLAADGSLRGYLGRQGVATKQRLLALEGAR